MHYHKQSGKIAVSTVLCFLKIFLYDAFYNLKVYNATFFINFYHKMIGTIEMVTI